MPFLDSLRGILALALLSLTGIVLMLVLDGAWDLPLLALSAAPMLIGGARAVSLARRRREPLRD